MEPELEKKPRQDRVMLWLLIKYDAVPENNKVISKPLLVKDRMMNEYK